MSKQISTKVALTDGITPIARNIVNALQIMNNNLRTAKQASGAAFDTRGMKQAEELLGDTMARLDDIERAYKKVKDGQNEYNKSVQQGTGNANSLLSTIKSLAGAYVGIQGASALVDMSDTLTSNTARLSLAGETYGETNTDAALQGVYSAAQNSRGDYSDFTGQVAKLGLTAGDQFSGTDDITRFVELVNKNLVVGGASSQEQASATYQLTQAMASGRLQGDEYRSIIENAPLLAQAIEDYMIKVEGASGTMKEWAADGLLTAEVIKNAVYNSADEVEARFNSMPYTWGQVMTSIKNEATVALTPVLKLVGSLAQNWKTVRTVLLLVTTAVVAYKVARLAANIADGFSQAQALGMSGAKALLAGTTATLTGSTVAQTASQWALNTAMMSCPAFWLVGGLAAVAGIGLTVAANMDTATDAMTDMEAEIKDYTEEYRRAVDAINVKDQSSLIEAERARALYNSMDKLLGKTYLTVEETNQLKSAYDDLCEIIPSIEEIDLSSPVEDLNDELKKAVDNFYDLAEAHAYFNVYSQKLETAISEKIGLEERLSEINSELPDAIKAGMGATTTYTKISSAIYDAKKYDGFLQPDEYYNKIGKDVTDGQLYDENAEGFIYAYKLDTTGIDSFQSLIAESQSVSSAIDAANSDIDKWIAEMADYKEKAMAFEDENGDRLGDIAENTEKTVEELAFVRDLAEREAINRFTTAEVKIDMSGMTNKIDSEVDFDGFIGILSSNLEQALAIAAERAEVR